LNPTGKFTFPYNLKWHFHTKFINDKDNRKRFKNILFLMLPSKVTKILFIIETILVKNLTVLFS